MCPAGTFGGGGNAAGCYPCLGRRSAASGLAACVDCVPNPATGLCAGERFASYDDA